MIFTLATIFMPTLLESGRKPHIKPNGSAILGGCVTRRQHRAGTWYFSREIVPVQGGYGALFAVMVQILLSAGAMTVQF